MNRFIIILTALLVAHAAPAQDNLNSEITVTHRIVPEEQAASRLNLLPELNLPQAKPGRLPMAAGVSAAPLSPYINMMEPTLAPLPPRYSWRGYAALGYGPLWNLAASAGYRVIARHSLQLDAFMQFDGFKYKSIYPDGFYPGNVHLRRNSGLLGTRLARVWTPGSLHARLTYDFSNYNFPLKNNQPEMESIINANRLKADVSFGGRLGAWSYNAAVDYAMLAFGGEGAPTHHGGRISARAAWNFNALSSWGLNLSQQLYHSTAGLSKGITRIEPFYAYSGKNFMVHAGVNADFREGNVNYDPEVVVSPNIDVVWRPSAHFNLWGRVDGRLEANPRAALYEAQPYLEATLETGFSHIYTADAGLTVGPWAGASITLFGGYAMAYDWLLPAIKPGTMGPCDLNGAHWGGEVAYSYNQYIQLNVRAEMAQNPTGDYTKGYAIWADHAKFNLTASAKSRPIKPLEIALDYTLRTGRNKVTADGYQNLLKVNNLSAAVTYDIDRQWSVWLRGENLLNRHWYLGPAIPSQGIVGLLGASVKF